MCTFPNFTAPACRVGEKTTRTRLAGARIPRPRHSLTLASATALVLTASAHATVSAPPISSHFAYHSEELGGGRCHDGIGVEFAPISRVDSYSIDYFDNYYNSEAGGISTTAELLQDGFSTPTSLYRGITGGTGPDPCTGIADGGGRFTQPPTVVPIYDDDKYPPLVAHTSKSSPRRGGTIDIKAASGTFPVTQQVTVEVALSASRKLYDVLYPDGLRVGGAGSTAQSSFYPPSIVKKGLITTLQYTVTTTKAGSVPLSFTFKAKTSMGKKARTIKVTGTSLLRFG